LTKKVKRNRISKRKKTLRRKYLLIFLSLILLCCLYIWQRVSVITLSARTKELRLEIQQKQKIHKYLQIEVTSLSSIERIETKGRQMGLDYPNLDKMGLIRESGDSTYMEKSGFAKDVWAKLKALQKGLLPGDQAIAKEIKHEL
jgi:cell division protein FtsL